MYQRTARAYVQDPTTVRAWYRQTLRWLHGTMQGIRGHRIGRTWSWFSVTYSALILDWFLYVVAWPFFLVWATWHSMAAGRGELAAAVYPGYAAYRERVTARDIMTPRPVVYRLALDKTVGEVGGGASGLCPSTWHSRQVTMS